MEINTSNSQEHLGSFLFILANSEYNKTMNCYWCCAIQTNTFQWVTGLYKKYAVFPLNTADSLDKQVLNPIFGKVPFNITNFIKCVCVCEAFVHPSILGIRRKETNWFIAVRNLYFTFTCQKFDSHFSHFKTFVYFPFHVHNLQYQYLV